MIIAGFAYRYEPDWMIDQLRENLYWVDGFVDYDTRDATEPWVPATKRTAELYKRARRLAGDRPCWFLQTAPDERFESLAIDESVRWAIDHWPTSRFSFNLRELYTPTAYRVDGIWGKKIRRRLYRLGPGGPMGAQPVHLDFNIYHLKMIEPENRRRRAEVFKAHNHWDNKTLGFDYLTDESGLQTEEIPAGRGYDPAYQTYEFSVPGFD